MITKRIVLLGHKDHGKSTLIGNLLIATGSASKERIEEAMGASAVAGRFEPAMLLDSFEEERNGGLTIDSARAQVEHGGTILEFIDVPGHEELVRNMINSASYADVALLVVSARRGERITAQTKRHAFIAAMLGIRRFIVAINKMDTVGYAKSSFDGIRKELDAFLERVSGQWDAEFIPISAYRSKNLKGRAREMTWYKGPTLLDALAEPSASRAGDAMDELRIMVQGSMQQGKRTLLLGRVASGSVHVNDSVKLLPSGNYSVVASLFAGSRRRKSTAVHGNVAIGLKDDAAAAYEDDDGVVIYKKRTEVDSVSMFRARLFFSAELSRINEADVAINGARVHAKIRITGVIDASTGSAMHRTDRLYLNAADAEIALDRPMCVEPFGRFQELGRFLVYTKGEFAGFGIVSSTS